MRTTSDQRRQAVQIATRLLDANEPHMLDIGETTLLAQVIIDCQAVFKLHAPIVDSALRLVTPAGTCTPDWSTPWRDMIASVAELRRANQ